MKQRKLKAYELREIAVMAQVDPRTVASCLRRKPVRDLNRERIEKAVREFEVKKGEPRS